MPSTPKIRLDQAMVEKGLAPSRHQAQALITSGKILVNDYPVNKSGARIPLDAVISLQGEPLRYVSRGGLKLEAALDAFRLDVSGLVCLDVGASTGGFTDCLLQHGAGRVFAVDVGYGQLAWRIRRDTRVAVIERTNIRYMPPEALDSPVDLITIDASFISLKIVVPATLKFLKKRGRIIALIKPQFEVGKGKVGKGGVVRNPDLHHEVIRNLKQFFTGIHLRCGTVIPSPILGPKGNSEFFILLQYKSGFLQNMAGSMINLA